VNTAPVVETVVRGLFARGITPPAGASLAELMAISRDVKPGPQVLPPRLGVRSRPGYDAMIVIIDDKKRISTGIKAEPGEDPARNPFALTKLEVYVQKKLDKFMGRLAHGDKTVGEVMVEYLEDKKPAMTRNGEPSDRYLQLCWHAREVAEKYANTALKNLELNSAEVYADWRTEQQVKSQAEDVEEDEKRFVARSTAVEQALSFKQMVRYYCRKHKIAQIEMDSPVRPATSPRWLSWEQIFRLIMATRGYQFVRTRLRGDPPRRRKRRRRGGRLVKRFPNPVEPLAQHLARSVRRRGRRRAPKVVARPAVKAEPAAMPDVTYGLPPPAPKRAKGADVSGPDTGGSLEMVEAMMDEGINVVAATSMAPQSALCANRPSLGRPSEEPRLDDRTPSTRANSEAFSTDIMTLVKTYRRPLEGLRSVPRSLE
jgi:hypothetical protein